MPMNFGTTLSSQGNSLDQVFSIFANDDENDETGLKAGIAELFAGIDKATDGKFSGIFGSPNQVEGNTNTGPDKVKGKVKPDEKVEEIKNAVQIFKDKMTGTGSSLQEILNLF